MNRGDQLVLIIFIIYVLLCGVSLYMMHKIPFGDEERK